MDDKRLTGVLVSFFHNGSVFHEVLQRRRSHATIHSLEVFISELQNNTCFDRTKLKEISKTITRVVNINHQNSISSGYQLEYSHGIETIFRFILNLPCFVTWISDIGDYLVSIPVPKTEPYNFIRTADLLSNQISGDLLKNHPTPALVIQLFRQEYSNVLPSLEIHVYAKLNGKVERRKYCLQTVICLNSRNELTTYFRQSNDDSEATWSLTKVQQWNRFIKVDLPGLEKQLKFLYNLKYLDIVQDDFIAKQSKYIMQKSIFLVYVPVQIKNEALESGRNQCANLTEKRNQMAPEISLKGEWKGIHGDENSCFMDSLLMSWLFHPKSQAAFIRIFKSSLDRLQYSGQASKLEDVKSLLGIIRTIVGRLKSDPPYCEKSVTWELRKVLEKHNSNVCGEMLDVTEFINLLFGCSLGVPYFITYRPIFDVVKTQATKEIGSYSHQIIIGPVEGLESVNVATLLERSMHLQGIKFKAHPEPFLIIKLPLNNGRLVGVQFVLPSLELCIGDTVEEPGLVFEYQLSAIICLRDMHYTAFIRKREDDWIYFDSMSPRLNGPEVEFLAGFTSDLLRGSDSNERKLKVERVLQKSCLYVYIHTATRNGMFTDQKAEPEIPCTQPGYLQSSNMQVADEFVSMSTSNNGETNTSFIERGRTSPARDPSSNSNFNYSDHNTAEKRRIKSQKQNVPADVFEILECLLYLMQSNSTSLFPIFQGISEKLKTKSAADGYMISEEIHALPLIGYIEWSTETPCTSQTPLASVWNNLVKFAEGGISDNICIELPEDKIRWISVQGLYDKFSGRKETSPHGLIISLQRIVLGQEPISIDNKIFVKTSKGWKTLKLFSVICSIEFEGLVTYIFDAKRDYWTKKLPDGKMQVLPKVDSYYLEFSPAEGINHLPDKELVESHSIGVIYTDLLQ